MKRIGSTRGRTKTELSDFNLSYRHACAYYGKQEFLRMFANELARALCRYHDAARRKELLSIASSNRISFLNMTNFLMHRWNAPLDLGRYIYSHKGYKTFDEFMDELVVTLKSREQAGEGTIDLTSVFFYLSEIKKRDNMRALKIDRALKLLAQLTYYPLNTYDENPYVVRFFSEGDSSRVAKALGLKHKCTYANLVGKFLKELLALKEKYGQNTSTPKLIRSVLINNNCRKNQEGRLGYVFSMYAAKIAQKLKGIEDLTVESREVIEALEKIKEEKGYKLFNVRALIKEMQEIRDNGTITTIDRVAYTLYSKFKDYFGVPAKDAHELGIEPEYLEAETYLDSMSNVYSAMELQCSKLSFEEIKEYIYGLADLLMISYRRRRCPATSKDTKKSLSLLIKLKGVSDISLRFVRDIKELMAELSSRRNVKFVANISYEEDALRPKGGLQQAEYVRIISDIHADVNAEYSYAFNFGSDFVINAGDTAGDALAERDWIRNYMRRGVVIPGNHLGYNLPYPEKNGQQNIPTVKSTIHRDNTKNVQITYLMNHFSKNKEMSYLSNGIIETDFAYIIGTPLYTDFKLFGEDNKVACMVEAKNKMNDFRYCFHYSKEKSMVLPFSPDTHCKLFNVSVGYIRNRVRYIRETEGDNHKNIIVVTHHAPTPYSIAPEYKNDPLSAAFASDLRWLLDENPEIKMWVHAHVHSPVDYIYKNCRIIAEPFGYYWENGNEFKTEEDIANYGKRIPISTIKSHRPWTYLAADEIEAGKIQVYES